jgi:hypothetical protein
MFPSSRDPGRRLPDAQGSTSLQPAETVVTARDLMHLDLYSDDASQQVERLLDLGATTVRENDDPDDTYVVMRDPEGDEFCVC